MSICIRYATTSFVLSLGTILSVSAIISVDVSVDVVMGEAIDGDLGVCEVLVPI